MALVATLSTSRGQYWWTVNLYHRYS